MGALSRSWLPCRLRPHIYTLSIACSGLLVAAGILGSLGILWVALCIGVFNLLTWKSVFLPASGGVTSGLEGARHICVAKTVVPAHITRHEAAQLVFNQLD